MIIPIIFTAFVSVTNWSTGHTLTKDQSIEVLESKPYLDPDAAEVVFELAVYQDPETEDFLFLLIDDDTGELIAGIPRPAEDEPAEDGTVDLSEYDIVEGDDRIPASIGPFVRISGADLFADQVGTSARVWCVGAHFDAR